MKFLSVWAFLILLQIDLGLGSVTATSQTPGQASARVFEKPEGTGNPNQPVLPAEEALPSEPGASGEVLEPLPTGGGGEERGHVPWAAVERQQPFSRVGVGADVSPLGLGIKSAVVLTEYIDARGMVNFFNLDTGPFEMESFKVDAKVHLSSVGASLDFYPWKSVWRFSGGLMLTNGNQLTAKTIIVPATSFKVNSNTFYSAPSNPVNGTGVLGMHRNSPGFMASFGFGKFIPRSNRHWSFPSEFGAVFTGAPTLSVVTGGAVCQDIEMSQCSNVADSGNPIGAQFNSSLQAQLTKWRKALSSATIYPIFSYSVMYSFNVR